MPGTLVLGYGNPLRGDDALGPLAAGLLAGRFAGDGGVGVGVVPLLTPDLADLVRRFDRVILLDARAGGEPGALFAETVEAEAALPQTFTHHVTPGQLLAVTAALFGQAPRTFLLGVSAATFEVGQALSARVRASLPALVERAAAEGGGAALTI